MHALRAGMCPIEAGGATLLPCYPSFEWDTILCLVLEQLLPENRPVWKSGSQHKNMQVNQGNMIKEKLTQKE